MGRYLGHLHLVDAVIFLPNMLEVMLPMKRYCGFSDFVEKQKAGVAVDDRLFLWLLPILDESLKALKDIVGHRDNTGTACGFCILYNIPHKLKQNM